METRHALRAEAAGATGDAENETQTGNAGAWIAGGNGGDLARIGWGDRDRESVMRAAAGTAMRHTQPER